MMMMKKKKEKDQNKGFFYDFMIHSHLLLNTRTHVSPCCFFYLFNRADTRP